jgi:pSer/pThr/pTyr-binding forkhead associated (FHA) protein
VGYFDPGAHPAATLTLLPHNDQFAPKRVAVPEGEAVVVGRLLAGGTDDPAVPLFPSQLVSRKHALLAHRNGRVCGVV